MSETNTNEIAVRLEEVTAQLEDAEKELAILMENMPGGILVYEEVSGKFLSISKGCLDMFGCDEGTFREYFYDSFDLFICKQDRTRIKQMLQDQMEFLDGAELTFRVRDLLGELKYIEFRAKRVHEHSGKCVIYAIINDITERMQVQQEMQQITQDLFIETRRYQLLQEAVEDITFDFHVTQDEMEYFLPSETNNKRSIPYFEQKKRLSEYIEEKELDDITYAWKRAMTETVKDTIECQVYYASRKKYVWSRIYYASFTDKTEKVVRIVGSIKDISEDRKEREELSKQANCDSLTGLYNRRAMQMVIKDYLRKTKSKKTHAVLMVDTDNFKAINDNMGHLFGDEVIKFVANSIRKTFRESDFVGRVGGDEFLVFMKNADANAAKARAQTLNKVMRQTFEKDDIKVQISCSIGIAIYPENGIDYDMLYQNADAALYKAKEKGRDRYEISGE